MKAFVITITLLAVQAFAYNESYTPVVFGKLTVIETNKKSNKDAKVISLLVDVNSSTGRHPMVQIANQDQKNCGHKQTLIMFSGYDMEARTYKRTYEVQIERDPSAACYLAVYASTSNQGKMNAARVNILPGK